MKEMRVNVNIEFIIKETGAYPPYSGQAIITSQGADGQEWKGGCRYDGNEVDDVVRTLTRMGHFAPAVAKMAQAALPGFEEVEPTSFEDLAVPPKPEQPEKPKDPASAKKDAKKKAQEKQFAEQREALYKKLHTDIQGWKYGVIRKFCQDNNLSVTVPNGANKVDLADQICQEFRDREDKGSSDEKNNQPD